MANPAAEILDTTDFFAYWKLVSGINNEADVGTRAIIIKELKRNGVLTGPAWLKRPQNEWPEQMSLTFASEEDKIPTSIFLEQDK